MSKQSVNTLSETGISRRGFMIGATSAGFTLAFVPHALLSSAPAHAMAEKLFEPTIWYSIAPSGEVSVAVIFS